MPDYTLDGKPYTEDQVKRGAEKLGVPVEEFIKQKKLTVKKTKKETSPFPKTEWFDPLGLEKMVESESVKKSEAKFDAKKFAKDKTIADSKGFYEKGEENIKASGVKIKEEEKQVVNEIFDNFSTFNYKQLSQEEKQIVDDNAVTLLSKQYKVGENYSLSSSDIELKSIELLSKANKGKTNIEEASYGARVSSGIAKGLNYVGEMFSSVPETIYSTFAWPQNAIAYATGNKAFEASPEAVKKITGTSNPVMDYFIKEQKEIGKKIDIYDNANYDSKSISENMSNGNWGDAFKLIGSGIAESAPISIGMMLGGSQVGVAKLAAGSTALFAGPNIREQKEDNAEDSEMAQVLSGFGMAAAESVFSSIGEGSLGNVYKDIIKKEGTEQGAIILKNGLVLAYETALKKYGVPVAMAGEGLEEVATTITQNLINNKKPFEGVLDSFIQGVSGGGLYGSPLTISKGVSGFKDGLALHRVNTELKTDASNSLIEAFNPNVPVSQAQINITKIKGSPRVLSNQIQDAINKGEMTEEEGNKIKSDFSQTYGISNKLAPLNLLESLFPEAVQLSKEKNDLLKLVKQVDDKELAAPQLARIAEINGKLNGIAIESAESRAAKRTGSDSALTNEEAIQANISDDVNKARSAVEKLGLGETAEVPELKTANDVRTFLEENTDLTEEEINRYEDSNGLFVPLKNGKQALIVNQEEAAMGFNITTGQHEFMHQLINKAIGENSEAQVEVGDRLYKHLESYLGGDLFNSSEFKRRYDSYKADHDSFNSRAQKILENNAANLAAGKISQEAHDLIAKKANDGILKSKGKLLEETLPLLSESLASGDIKYNETFFIKIGDMLRKLLQNVGIKNVNFGNGKEVFNFVRDYNKSFESGKFTKAFGKLATSGTASGVTSKATTDNKSTNTVKQSKLSSEIFKQELSALNEQYDEGYGDMESEEYLPQKQNLESKIKAALKKEAESPLPEVSTNKEVSEEDEVKEIIKKERRSLSSDKVQNIYNSKGKEGSQDIIDLFKPITKKIVDRRRDAPGFDRELLTDEIESGKGGILDLIMKYDPKSGVPLAAYINKYLPFRSITSSRRVLDAQFNKDASEEVTLTATETADQGLTEYAPEKPTYKNAIESNVFDKPVLDNINAKILTVIRTLKTRIDEPISLNRTITPLIAEIRDNIGKQVDIDVKTAMGGKKDNQLKNWLIKNKKYVLENMTTTFLMGHDGKGGIPQAIQKKIDGKWANYPEWVGKKIDRESVSTDLAGRTAGHELVRRLPNVVNNLANADYLSQVLMDDGNPIRGRKEALAKAIAEEAAFDIIKNDFVNEGSLYEAFASNQERLGVELNSIVSNEFARQTERGNVKESKASAINSGLFILEDNNWDFNSKEYNEFLSKLPSRDKTYFNTFLNNNNDIVSLANRYNEIWMSNEGVKYEANTYKALNKYLKNKYKNKEIYIESPAPDRFNNSAPDLVLKINKNNNRLIIELKADKRAPISSLTNSKILGDITFTKDFIDSEEFIKAMENSPKRKAFIDEINNLPKEYKRITKRGNLVISNKGIDILAEKSSNVIIPVSMQSIIDINFGKDLLQIGGQGLYKFRDIKGLENIPLLSGKAYLYSRFMFNSTSDRKGKYISERVFARLDNNWDQKSKYDILTNTEKTINEISKVKESKALSDNFNKILEETRGIKTEEQFSDITARTLGASKGKFRFFMSPGAEDFAGLLYDFMGKGKLGEQHKAFFEDKLLKPYMEGVTRIDRIKNNIKQGYKALKAEHPVEAKKLGKVIEGTTNTYDQAVRVFLWDTNGVEIPGLSKAEVKDLSNIVKNDPALMDFANKLSAASGQLEGWISPTKYWNVESIVSDLHSVTEKGGRRQILGEFVDNADAIFSTENLNKIEVARGSAFREALEDSLFRMKTGTNRSSTDKFAGQWASWVNNSSGAIMFLNTRSAALQLISATNFLNWKDNNPLSAAKAFANQPQYWKDFASLWNSPSLKERRSGLKSDVDEAEIANAVAGSKNKVKSALAYLLKLGYTPTQMADSFAICSGGSTFYRNRIKTYEKQGFSVEEAETKAYQDFLKTSEESQQSADPSKVSQQQASSIGRIILAFGNTPMQYNRLIKKSTRDLINGRGDAKTHISKILYYGAVQNMVFSSLQSALFALAFDDEPEDEKEKKKAEEKKNDKYLRIANSMLDTVLRGTGVYGAVAATIKNTAIEYKKQLDKGWKGDQARTLLAATSVSPPINSKLTKLYSATQTYKFDKAVIDQRGFDLTLDGKFNPSPSWDIVGKLTAATTNFPLDRVVDKANNVAEILDQRNATWQKLSLGFGWKTFDVGVKNEEEDLIKAKAKETKEFDTAVKKIETNIAKKEALEKRIDEMTDEQYDKYYDSIMDKKDKALIKKYMIWDKVEENKNKKK